MVSVPSVTTIGGMSSFQTRMPLKAPSASADRRAQPAISSGTGTPGIGRVEHRHDHAGQRQVGGHREIDGAGQDHHHLAERQHDQDRGVVEDRQQLPRLGEAREARGDQRRAARRWPAPSQISRCLSSAFMLPLLGMPAAAAPASRRRAPCCRDVATMRPSRMTMTRSRMPRTSGSSDETMMTDRPCATSSPMKPCTAALEPMSMPLVGSSRMMTLGCVASHLAITTFCWLPPDSVPTSWLSEAARRSSRSVYVARQREFLGQLQEAGLRGLAQRGQRDVLEDRQADDDALLAALLGHIDDAGVDRVGGRLRRDRLAVERDRAALTAGSCRTAPASPRCGRRRPGRRSRGFRPAQRRR